MCLACINHSAQAPDESQRYVLSLCFLSDILTNSHEHMVCCATFDVQIIFCLRVSQTLYTDGQTPEYHTLLRVLTGWPLTDWSEHPIRLSCYRVSFYVWVFIVLGKSALQILPLINLHVSHCVWVGVCYLLRNRMLPDSWNYAKIHLYKIEHFQPNSVSLHIDLDLHFRGQIFGILFKLRISPEWWETSDRKSCVEWRHCKYDLDI